MANPKDTLNSLNDTMKTVPKLYDDVVHPIAASTGKLLSIIPRAINAALSPIEQWIAIKDYNLEKTKILLAKELENVPEENIVTPDPYVAVPAIQSISYCMNCDDLRSMYSKLLAKAMNKDTKNSTHPAFVEVIRQLSPNDCLFLNSVKNEKGHPIANIRFQKPDYSFGLPAEGIDMFHNLMILKDCVLNYNEINFSVSNLIRLGISNVTFDFTFTDEYYSALKETSIYKSFLNDIDIYRKQNGRNNYVFYLQKGIFQTTPFGSSFIGACVL